MALYHGFSVGGEFDIVLIVVNMSLYDVRSNATYLMILCLADVLRMFLTEVALFSDLKAE